MWLGAPSSDIIEASQLWQLATATRLYTIAIIKCHLLCQYLSLATWDVWIHYLHHPEPLGLENKAKIPCSPRGHGITVTF